MQISKAKRRKNWRNLPNTKRSCGGGSERQLLRGRSRTGDGRVGGDELWKHEHRRRGGRGSAIRYGRAYGVPYRRRQIILVLQLQLRIV